MSRRVYLLEHAARGRRHQLVYLYSTGAYRQLGRLMQGQSWSRIESAALEQWISADQVETVTITEHEVQDG